MKKWRIKVALKNLDISMVSSTYKRVSKWLVENVESKNIEYDLRSRTIASLSFYLLRQEDVNLFALVFNDENFEVMITEVQSE